MEPVPGVMVLEAPVRVALTRQAFPQLLSGRVPVARRRRERLDAVTRVLGGGRADRRNDADLSDACANRLARHRSTQSASARSASGGGSGSPSRAIHT